MGRQNQVPRRRWGAAVAAVMAATLLTAAPAQGGPADDKARADRKLQQAAAALENSTARARQAGVAYAQANQLLPAAQDAVASARGHVAAAQVQANTAARLAEKARRSLAVSEANLRRTEQDVDQARDHLGEFVRLSYEGAPYMAASAMLGARTPDELFASFGYLDNLAGSERRAIDRVTRARLVAAQQRAEVAEVKRRVDAAEARARQALGVARDQEAIAAAAEQRVVELVGQRRNSLKVAEEEKNANARQYAEAQAESRRIAAALREAARKARAEAARKAREEARKAREAAARNGTPGARPRPPAPPRRVGVLSMPVNGWKSSDFGRRYDPYYGVWQLHAGTDFAAPGGAPIRAADGGVVVRAGWNGGYGNYTCIYHGDLPDGRGLSTCYAHQSRILAGRGESVDRGQVIGRVGTTGASTGNHLHFEVRLDGEPVNPMRWL